MQRNQDGVVCHQHIDGREDGKDNQALLQALGGDREDSPLLDETNTSGANRWISPINQRRIAIGSLVSMGFLIVSITTAAIEEDIPDAKNTIEDTVVVNIILGPIARMAYQGAALLGGTMTGIFALQNANAAINAPKPGK